MLQDTPEGSTLQDTDLVFPVSRVWPMGFSWSSLIGQEITLSSLLGAGLLLEHVLCEEAPAPRLQSELAVVQTDDVLFFHDDEAAAQARVLAYEAEMQRRGVGKNSKKDVTAGASLTGNGVSHLRRFTPCRARRR